MARTIEESNGKSVAYDSVFVEPSKLNVFNSDLSFKVIKEIAKQPVCAMDIARNIRQHEQKIYYHLRKFERAGIIKIVRTEKRHSMTAKMYGLVAPVVAAKLHEDGSVVEEGAYHHIDPNLQKFFAPFIENGMLNAKIIIGDTYSHGEYDSYSPEGAYTFDFAVVFGRMLKKLEYPHYKFDTEVTDEDLHQNLILFGNPKTNTVINKLNGKLPLYFDPQKEWGIFSKETKSVYSDPRTGIIIKCSNPFKEGKKILILGGVGRRGTQSAILACTKESDKIIQKLGKDGDICIVLKGFDANSDKIIDSIKVLE